MLSVYDGTTWRTIANDDYYLRELASGLDEIVFNVSIRDPIYAYILEEAVIRDRDKNYYIIKQVDAGNDKAKVVAQINIDDFKATMYLDYSNNSATVYNTVLGVLPANWNCIDRSHKTIRRTIPTSDTTKEYNVTAWEVMQACCDVYNVRFRFDNANKIVYIIDPDLYTSTGAFATRDLNLKSLNYKGKSDNFVTRLYASGADGMTFAIINDGKPYVDNFEYTNKVICGYWSDDRYTDPQSLLDDAKAKVAEMARPAMSYDCDVLDLASTNPDMYGFEDFALFNVITLIDDAKNTRNDFQIVEKWTYPYYPVNNKVVLSSETPKLQSVVAAIVNAVQNPVSTFQQIIQSAIANSTALITGNHGGYVVFHDSTGDGYPDEILIMDTPDISTATKVWRWNAAGLGYSNTGYNGSYGTAITMDGSIVADFITAGHINGALITAGTISAEALQIAAQLETGAIHSYLPYDAIIEPSRWAYSSTGGYHLQATTITVEGVTHNALRLDGEDAYQNYDFNNFQCETDLIGRAEITIAFNAIFSADFTTPSGTHTIARILLYVGSGFYSQPLSIELEAGKTYLANTPYEFKATGTPQHSAEYFEGKSLFVLYGYKGVSIYVYDLYLISTGESYKSAALSFTTDGLNSTVQAGSIISTINQSAESVSIQAAKINLTGDLSLRGDFHSYDPNDDTNFAFMDSGNIAFFNNGVNVFTIASVALTGSNGAGIFFGDEEDPATLARYSYITQEFTQTPTLLVRKDGSQVVPTSAGQALIEGDFSVYGTSKFYGNVLNSNGGVQFVSDRRKKRSIKDLVVKKAKSFIMALKPKEFKFIKGISTSDRKHHGFIAQDVKEAMGADDWGVYCEDKENDFIGLRYDELIADMVTVIQDQEKRIEALERALHDKSDV